MSADNAERRRFARIANDSQARLTLGEECLDACVIDVSMNGVLLELDGELPDAGGRQATVVIQLTGDGSNPIRLEGEIVHQHQQQIGLACARMDLDSATRLRRLVELNLSEPGLLDRELAQLIATHQN